MPIILALLLLLTPLSVFEQKAPTMNFDSAFDLLMMHEGGYSNIKADPGGETMMGITSATARANGYDGPMQALPIATAKAIYRKQYWDAVKADLLPEVLKFHVFDAAANSGPQQAIKWLQQVAGTTADGILGSQTLAAVSALDASEAVSAYSGKRLEFMTKLKVWPVFGAGWARRIAANLQLREA